MPSSRALRTDLTCPATILAGIGQIDDHHRLLHALIVGMETIPCVTRAIQDLGPSRNLKPSVS